MDEFQRRSSDSGEASVRDRCNPAPSGSADGGGGTRVSGVGGPDETLRAMTTIQMIRGYGKNVATNPNEPRFGADRAAPLQGADIGRPSRSEQRRVPSDDIYPTDRSSRESERHGRGALRPKWTRCCDKLCQELGTVFSPTSFAVFSVIDFSKLMKKKGL